MEAFSVSPSDHLNFTNVSCYYSPPYLAVFPLKSIGRHVSPTSITLWWNRRSPDWYLLLLVEKSAVSEVSFEINPRMADCEEVQVFLVHAVKAYGRSRSTARHIIKLSTRRRWMVNFSYRDFTSGKLQIIGGPVGPEPAWTFRRIISCCYWSSNTGPFRP